MILGNELTYPHPRVERVARVLKDELHIRSDLSRLIASEAERIDCLPINGEKSNPPVGCLNESEIGATCGCLAAAAFSYQRQSFGASNMKIDPIYRFDDALHGMKIHSQLVVKRPKSLYSQPRVDNFKSNGLFGVDDTPGFFISNRYRVVDKRFYM